MSSKNANKSISVETMGRDCLLREHSLLLEVSLALGICSGVLITIILLVIGVNETVSKCVGIISTGIIAIGLMFMSQMILNSKIELLKSYCETVEKQEVIEVVVPARICSHDYFGDIATSLNILQGGWLITSNKKVVYIENRHKQNIYKEMLCNSIFSIQYRSINMIGIVPKSKEAVDRYIVNDAYRLSKEIVKYHKELVLCSIDN